MAVGGCCQWWSVVPPTLFPTFPLAPLLPLARQTHPLSPHENGQQMTGDSVRTATYDESTCTCLRRATGGALCINVAPSAVAAASRWGAPYSMSTPVF